MIYRKLALLLLFAHAVVFGLMALMSMVKSDAAQSVIFSSITVVCILLFVITMRSGKRSRRSDTGADLLEFIETRKEEKEDKA